MFQLIRDAWPSASATEAYDGPSEEISWLRIYLENKDGFSFITKIGSRRLSARVLLQIACHQYLIAGSLCN